MKLINRYGKYILLFIFLGVLIATSIKTKDIGLMFFGSILFVTGWSFAMGIDDYGNAIQRYKKAGENVISILDQQIADEEKKQNRKKKF